MIMIWGHIRNIAFVAAIAIILYAYTSVTAITTVKAEHLDTKSTMQTYTEEMNPGWNLGNTFEASGSETSWGNPLTTKDIIDQIAAQGYKSIRIPITWNHRMGDAPDYAVNPEFMERIQEVVDWSLDAGLYVMINLHHDSHWILKMETGHDEVVARYNALWTQISAHFKDYPLTLSFESINEPRFSDDWNKDTPEYFSMLDELHVSFYDIVRKSGGINGERPLIIPSVTANHSQVRLDELSKTITKLNDDNLIATIHYYGYYPFSINLGEPTFSEVSKNDLIQAFDRAYNTFVAKGIPVIVGEFGLLGFDKSVETIERGEILKYMEFLSYYAKEQHLTLMLWDNGQHYDRRNNTWKNQDIFNVMKAGWEGRSSNSKSDLLFIKKDAPIDDVEIEINLNGHTLTAINHGKQALTLGEDYVMDDHILTLKASFIERVRTSELGEKAVLTCKFSAGADWDLHVIHYDTPILKGAEGTTALFVVPTTFNGDRLATMEATYISGSHAGPNNWTPYEEFNHSFTPDYDLNVIKVTDKFFKEVNDGEVLLKFHYWSGEVLEYTLLKTGSKIVGVSSTDKEVNAAPEEVEAPAPTEDIDAVELPSDANQPSENNLTLIIVTAVIGLVFSILMIKRKYSGKKG